MSLCLFFKVPQIAFHERALPNSHYSHPLYPKEYCKNTCICNLLWEAKFLKLEKCKLFVKAWIHYELF